MTDKQIIIDAFNSAWNRKVATESSYGKLASKEVFENNNEDKQIIIDGFNLEYIKELLYNGQRSAITTKIFEEIIEKLERKEQECEELKRIRDGNFLHALEEQKRADKLSKTLTEIKEIAEIAVNFCKGCGGEDYECIDCTNGGRAQISKEILQKISEVEDADKT